MPAGMPRVGVKFHTDADGMLTVTAKEEWTGTTSSLEVKPMHGPTDGDVDKMLKESYSRAKEDYEERRRVDLMAEIGTMLRHTLANIGVAKPRLDRETFEDLTDAIAAAEAVQRSLGLPTVQSARDALDRATIPPAAVLMGDVV